MDSTLDLRTEIREFLRSRRARIAPEMTGLPAYGGRRRVKGLRREEVALLAGVSVEYYVRIERGSLAGTSDGVLDALATALQLDEAERDHLFHLARQSGTPTGRRHPKPPATVRPALQDVLDAITGAPALIRNGRHDVLAMNGLGRALYSPVLADPRRPANTARFVYLHPDEARSSSSTTTRWREMRPRCCVWKWAGILTTRSSSLWSANYQRAVSCSVNSGHLRTCGCTDTGASV